MGSPKALGADMTALSILDLVRVTEGTDARGALDNARDLAAHAEQWGYGRFWVAEHHNMAGVASAATAVVVGHIAAGTRTIRVQQFRGAARGGTPPALRVSVAFCPGTPASGAADLP